MNKWNWQRIDWPDIIFTVIMWASIIAGVACMIALAAIGLGII